MCAAKTLNNHVHNRLVEPKKKKQLEMCAAGRILLNNHVHNRLVEPNKKNN